MVYAIDKSVLIEEALTAQQSRQIFNNNGNGMEIASAPVSMIPGAGAAAIPMRMAAGYSVGSQLGHPIAGTLLGRDAALGAASNHTPGLSVKDVYTPKNLFNKALAGTATAGSIIGLNHMVGDGNEMVDAIGVGAGLTAPVVHPALGYGLGKMFGSSRPGRLDRK